MLQLFHTFQERAFAAWALEYDPAARAALGPSIGSLTSLDGSRSSSSNPRAGVLDPLDSLDPLVEHARALRATGRKGCGG